MQRKYIVKYFVLIVGVKIRKGHFFYWKQVYKKLPHQCGGFFCLHCDTNTNWRSRQKTSTQPLLPRWLACKSECLYLSNVDIDKIFSQKSAIIAYYLYNFITGSIDKAKGISAYFKRLICLHHFVDLVITITAQKKYCD